MSDLVLLIRYEVLDNRNNIVAYRCGSIMAYRDVILEEDGSLSLNDNTQFIQEYNLDYSDEDR